MSDEMFEKMIYLRCSGTVTEVWSTRQFWNNTASILTDIGEGHSHSVYDVIVNMIW